jgi:hypothetical protein
VRDGVVVATRGANRRAVRVSDRIRELSLALLDGGDALGQLTPQSTELLLGRDANRVQPLLLALDRDGLGLTSAEEGHASMICVGGPFSCLLRGALEALFRAGATHDLFSLAEPEAGLLDTQRLPEGLQLLVELLDLCLDGRVETLGELLPEHLALFRDPLDLRVDLIRCHVISKRSSTTRYS